MPPRPRAKGATILAVANQKGGVAKTTSVASLGAAFAELGNRVLLVDLDPQACLTYSLGIDPDQVAAAIHEVLTGATGLTEIIQECGRRSGPQLDRTCRHRVGPARPTGP